MNIAVLTSGGVDSSTALYLLKKQGYNPTAFYIKVWLEDDLSSCPWKEDLKYVKDITKKLGVNLEIVNLQKAYWDKVISYTFKVLREGKTPNPDIFCNKLIKFGVFDKKYGKDFDRIATGHYARITYYPPSGEASSSLPSFRLLQARDKDKDQTYFLSQMKAEQLKKAMFPIGDLLKSEVREIAKRVGLSTYNRPDSQGLCFLGKVNFKDFLKKHVGIRRGNIVDIDSKRIVGKHEGYWFFTIGQREGLNIGGSKKPYYVCAKDAGNNVVYVAKGQDNPYLYKDEVSLKQLNILAKDLLKEKKEYLVKLRHPHKGIFGKAQYIKDLTLKIKLKSPAFAITEGQFGVLYDGEVIVAGGEICSKFD